MYAELSNFIKAICHPGGHWSWGPKKPRDKARRGGGGGGGGEGGGLCHQHPCVGGGEGDLTSLL